MTELFAVITITMFAVVSPGPDFAMVTRNSLLLSRRAGILTSLGIGAGVWVHVTYSVLGIGILIQHSIWLFTTLKLVGAAYLVWIGVKMLRARPTAGAFVDTGASMSAAEAFRTGLLTNALNPKTTVFVVSLFIQVIEPTTSLGVQLAYGAFISAAHIGWFTLVALFFSGARVRSKVLKTRQWVDRVFGVLLMGFGVTLATATISR